MKHLFFITVMFIAAVLRAQTIKPGWQWAMGATENVTASAVTTSANGDVYITGNFGGTAIFENVQINDTDGNLFVAKYAQDGKLLWIKQYVNAAASALASGTDGSLYLSGSFSGTAKFGNIILTSHGNEDVFIARLDATGMPLWAHSGGGNGRDLSFMHGMAVNQNNNVVICGEMGGAGIFDGDSISGKAYMVKYDAAGNVLWAKSPYVATGYSFLADVATDHDGDIYITGDFNDTLIVDSTAKLASGNNSNAYTARFDANGHLIWAREVLSYSFATGMALTCDANKNVFVFGESADTLNFDGLLSPPEYLAQFFLTKYDRDGNRVWVKRFGGPGDLSSYQFQANDILVDANNNVDVLGKFTNILQINGQTRLAKVGPSIFVAQFSNDGSLSWANYGGCSYETEPGTIAVYGSNLYAVGFFQSFNVDSTAQFGYQSVKGSHSNNMFLAKLTDVTGINKQTAANNEQPAVYPNPFSKQLTVFSSQLAVSGWQLVDINGRTVYRGATTGDKTLINTAQLPAGNYVMKLTDKDGKLTSVKLVKE